MQVKVVSDGTSPGVSWQVAGEPGAIPVTVSLCPDDVIEAQSDANGVLWTSPGEHAYFQFENVELPPGWYEWRGQFDCSEGAITLPSFHPGYGDTGVPDGKVALPGPSADGQAYALVLFAYPVFTLRWHPGVSRTRFRMHEVSLRRLSRVAALRLMLSGKSGSESFGAMLRQTVRYAVDVWRSGVQKATSDLFDDYTRRVRARELNDHASWIRGLAASNESPADPGNVSGDLLAPFIVHDESVPEATPFENEAWRLAHECRLLESSGLFDAEYYRCNNPDVARAGADPLLHFCQYGWRALRNPNPDFDVWWYWSVHLDPTRERINPLVHYALVGRDAGLATYPQPYRPESAGHAYPQGAAVRRICLFAGYDVDGLIDGYVIDYLRELSRHADVYYLADGRMQPGELEKLDGLVKAAWAFKHRAYDFGSYSQLARKLVGWDVIGQYDELIFANDSCYLLHDLDAVFADMDGRACDWWGLQATKGIAATRNKKSNQFPAPIPMAKVKGSMLAQYETEYTYDFLVGSYFMAFRKPVIEDPQFRKLVDSVVPQTSKLNIIRKYEIGIGRQLMARNHPFETYIEDLYPFHPVYSERVFELIGKGFPFFKRYFLAENHYQVAGLRDWKERLRRIVPDAPVEQMERNLLRVCDYEKLYANLRIGRDRRGRAVLPALLEGDAFARADAACPKHDHWWVFTACAFSDTFSGNERAVFEVVRHDPSIKKIVLARHKYIDVDGDDVVVVPLRSEEGQHYLMRAGQIFIKHTPRRNLVYPVSPKLHNIINLWHGIPLKRIGYASRDMQHKLPAIAAEHSKCKAVISSSKVDTMAMASAFYPLSYNDIWLTGLPRNDFILRLFDALPDDLRAQVQRLKKQLQGRRLVLFVPTFKQAQGDGYYHFSAGELGVLDDWLKRNNAVLGVREHMADTARTYNRMLGKIGAIDVGHAAFPDIEMLYREASMLITDYSSCFIDFMLTGKPMLSFAYDYDHYANRERGLFYDMDFVFPGEVCRDFAQLAAALEHVFDTPEPAQQAGYAWKRRLFFDYVDDGNAQRVVDRVRMLYTGNAAN